jgi:hypothetical protein
MARIAPEMFRQRLLIEGYVARPVLDAETYDAIAPLFDSGIYVCVWSARRFASVIRYTCAEFEDEVATAATREFFELTSWETASF